jgi:hypothetical protein
LIWETGGADLELKRETLKPGGRLESKKSEAEGRGAHTCNPSTWEAKAGGWRVHTHTHTHTHTHVVRNSTAGFKIGRDHRCSYTLFMSKRVQSQSPSTSSD